MTLEEFINHDDREIRYQGKPVKVIGHNIHGVVIAVGNGQFDVVPFAELEMIDRRNVETR